MTIYNGTCRIEAIYDKADNTKEFHLSFPFYAPLGSQEQATDTFSFQSGQFLSLGFTEKQWRAYSIASAEKEKYVILIIRLVPDGIGSSYLRSAKIGDTFPFKGPFGHFTLSNTHNAHLVFCATGTGIAPFRSMIQTENKKINPRRMTLLYGGRTQSDIAYLDEINTWASNLEVHIGLSQEENPNLSFGDVRQCRITQFIEEISDFQDKEFYICGNGNMVRSVTELLQVQGLEKNQIRTESFN